MIWFDITSKPLPNWKYITKVCFRHEGVLKKCPWNFIKQYFPDQSQLFSKFIIFHPILQIFFIAATNDLILTLYSKFILNWKYIIKVCFRHKGVLKTFSIEISSTNIFSIKVNYFSKLSIFHFILYILFVATTYDLILRFLENLRFSRFHKIFKYFDIFENIYISKFSFVVNTYLIS